MTVPHAVAADIAWRTARKLRRSRGTRIALGGLAVGGAALGVAVFVKVRAAVAEAREKLSNPRSWLEGLLG